MGAARIGAGHIGVQPLDLMHKSVGHEEIECPVGDRRLRPAPLFLQPIENLIGAHGPMFFEQHLEHALSDLRQAQTVFGAVACGVRQRVVHTDGVIVLPKPHERHRLLRQLRIAT